MNQIKKEYLMGREDQIDEAPAVNVFSKTIEQDLTSYKIRMLEFAKTVIKNNFQVQFNIKATTAKDVVVKGTFYTQNPGKLAGKPITITGSQPVKLTLGHEVKEIPTGVAIEVFLYCAVGRSGGYEKIINHKDLIRYLIKNKVPRLPNPVSQV